MKDLEVGDRVRWYEDFHTIQTYEVLSVEKAEQHWKQEVINPLTLVHVKRLNDGHLDSSTIPSNRCIEIQR
ncbi:MAG: hypothetical protein OXC92_09040 [Flavobacteriaceae bacterium]|nr:hypothetical protein [Flavobacteriaceae bacterium]MCY4267731.1 hypothetical protein [Flavobacteriaceae bacterium]MCY4299957.1 hypothetical protein [Flavobacteriaceae bacterium]